MLGELTPSTVFRCSSSFVFFYATDWGPREATERRLRLPGTVDHARPVDRGRRQAHRLSLKLSRHLVTMMGAVDRCHRYAHGLFELDTLNYF